MSLRSVATSLLCGVSWQRRNCTTTWLKRRSTRTSRLMTLQLTLRSSKLPTPAVSEGKGGAHGGWKELWVDGGEGENRVARDGGRRKCILFV